MIYFTYKGRQFRTRPDLTGIETLYADVWVSYVPPKTNALMRAARIAVEKHFNRAVTK